LPWIAVAVTGGDMARLRSRDNRSITPNRADRPVEEGRWCFVRVIPMSG
jgi:hypothetical protein